MDADTREEDEVAQDHTFTLTVTTIWPMTRRDLLRQLEDRLNLGDALLHFT